MLSLIINLLSKTELQVLYADHDHTESIPDQDINTVVEQTFMEEAAELLEMADHLLKQWFEQRTNRILLQLQRAVHSLKGGSRMLGLETVQAIAYQLENAFEQFALHHFSSNIYDNLLESAIVWLKEAILNKIINTSMVYNKVWKISSSLKQQFKFLVS